jgi:hypothetical protein
MNNDENDEIILLTRFKNHIPNWGEKYMTNNNQVVTLTNTCSIDFHLLGLWYMSKIINQFDIIVNHLNIIEYENTTVNVDLELISIIDIIN